MFVHSENGCSESSDDQVSIQVSQICEFMFVLYLLFYAFTYMHKKATKTYLLDLPINFLFIYF